MKNKILTATLAAAAIFSTSFIANSAQAFGQVSYTVVCQGGSEGGWGDKVYSMYQALDLASSCVEQGGKPTIYRDRV